MFGFWDIVLIAAVSLQATCMAYLSRPQWKAVVFSLPIPFSLSVMALGRPVDASNVAALFLLYVFTAATRVLYYDWRVPIVAAIVISAAMYSAIGALLAPWISSGRTAFLVMAAAAFLFALVLLSRTVPRDEAAHRSPLPLYVKLPLIVAVVIGLVLAKSFLQGFMTAFPMVGVIGAYEARKSLYTVSDQIPTIILIILPLMMVSHFTHDSLGLGGSLLLGWAACASVLAVKIESNRHALHHAERKCPHCRRDTAPRPSSNAPTPPSQAAGSSLPARHGTSHG